MCRMTPPTGMEGHFDDVCKRLRTRFRMWGLRPELRTDDPAYKNLVSFCSVAGLRDLETALPKPPIELLVEWLIKSIAGRILKECNRPAAAPGGQ